MANKTDSMEWYILSDGIQYGPISFEAVKKIADNDRLKTNDFIRRADQEEWLRVPDVIALKNCLTKIEVKKFYFFPEGSLAWTWFQIVFPTVGLVIIALQLFQLIQKNNEIKAVESSAVQVIYNRKAH